MEYPVFARVVRKRRRCIARRARIPARRLYLVARYKNCDFTGREIKRLSKALKLPARILFVPSGQGFVGILRNLGLFIPDEYALDYALESCGLSSVKDADEFVEWFYSGDWIRSEKR